MYGPPWIIVIAEAPEIVEIDSAIEVKVIITLFIFPLLFVVL